MIRRRFRRSSPSSLSRLRSTARCTSENHREGQLTPQRRRGAETSKKGGTALAMRDSFATLSSTQRKEERRIDVLMRRSAFSVPLRLCGVSCPSSESLLYALALRIGLRLVYDNAVVQVRDVLRDVGHETGHFSEVRIGDVLRLVRQLVIVAVPRGRKERDRNSVASVLVVIAPAVDALRVPVRVEAVVEDEAMVSALVHRLDDVPKLRGKPSAPDELKEVRTAARTVLSLAAADHVYVELRNDRIPRNRWMFREPFSPVQAELFRRVPHEDQGSLWFSLREREFFGNLQDAHRSRRVIVRSIVDGVGTCRANAAKAVDVYSNRRALLGREARARKPRSLSCARVIDTLGYFVVHLERVVIERTRAATPNVIAVGADGDVLAAQLRVAPTQDRDDVSRGGLDHVVPNGAAERATQCAWPRVFQRDTKKFRDRAGEDSDCELRLRGVGITPESRRPTEGKRPELAELSLWNNCHEACGGREPAGGSSGSRHDEYDLPGGLLGCDRRRSIGCVSDEDDLSPIDWPDNAGSTQREVIGPDDNGLGIGSDCGCGIQSPRDERYRLEEGAILSARREAEAPNFAFDISRSLHPALFASPPTHHRIVGKDVHPRHQVSRGNRGSGRLGCHLERQLRLRRRYAGEKSRGGNHQGGNDVSDRSCHGQLLRFFNVYP